MEIVTSEVVQNVARFCQRNGLVIDKDKIVVGVSGGPDSFCLLHVLKTIGSKLDLKLVVAHLNHQLRGDESQADEDFVRDIAVAWQLPVFVEKRNVVVLATERKQSIEETARQLRYAFLWQVAAEVGAHKIAVGHNADDQVETILMHFLRGAGLVGLRGMLPLISMRGIGLKRQDISVSSLQTTPKLIRPLLETSRAEIEYYCQEHQLSPRYDHSNQDLKFFRNRIRHELIPQLETYNPNVRQVIQRTAKVIAADIEILNEQVEEAWSSVTKQESFESVEIDLQGWLHLPLAMKRAILRRAIQTLQVENQPTALKDSLQDIGFEHIETAIMMVEKGSTGTKITLPHGFILTIGYHSFIISNNDPSFCLQQPDQPRLIKDQDLKLNLPGITPLPHTHWQLTIAILPHNNLNTQNLQPVDRWEAYLDADIVGNKPILRTRQPGDIFSPLGFGGHHKKVNRFMIDEKIPADWRNHVLLLVGSNHQILWICGYRLAEEACLRATTQRVLHLRFERR